MPILHTENLILGELDVSDLYLGNTKVSAVYLGNKKIWPLSVLNPVDPGTVTVSIMSYSDFIQPMYGNEYTKPTNVIVEVKSTYSIKKIGTVYVLISNADESKNTTEEFYLVPEDKSSMMVYGKECVTIAANETKSITIQYDTDSLPITFYVLPNTKPGLSAIWVEDVAPLI